jgi:hypothetical protein
MFPLLGIVSLLVTTLAAPILGDFRADARKRASCKGRRHNRCVIDAMLSPGKSGGANAQGAQIEKG